MNEAEEVHTCLARHPKQAGLGIGLVMKLDFETGFSTLAKYFVKGTILEIDSKCKIKQYKGQMAKNCSTSYSFLLVSLILYYFRNLS